MNRSIVTAVSLLFLAAASFAAVSGERPISEPAYGPAPSSKYGIAAASDGRDFLVAWVDGLRNRANISHLYAARLNAAGDVLDPLGIQLPTISPEVFRVDIVFLGEAYLVYWDEPSLTNPSKSALMGARISRDGKLLDAVPRMLANNATVNVGGAASNGNRTVIVSADTMIVLDRDANVIDGPRQLSPGSAIPSASIVASNGSGFLVISQRAMTIDSTPLDANGIVGPTSTVLTITGPNEGIFDIASDGDSYVAIIRDGSGPKAQHLGAGGGLLEKWPLPINEAATRGLAFTGSSYVLFDGEPVQRTIGLRRLDRTGQPVGSYAQVVAGKEFSAATLMSNGSDAGFFWTDTNTTTELLSGTIVNGQLLTASKATSIAGSANAQSGPTAATGGLNSAIVWSELDGLYAGRITPDGQPLDGRGIRIGNRPSAEPGIVYDGTSYVIVWSEQVTSSSPTTSLVKMARLSPDSGALLDPAGIVLATPQCVGGVTLANGGASTLVAWSDCGHIVANTVAHDGAVGAAVTVAQRENTGAVSAAWNGQEWLLVWEDLANARLGVDGPPQYDQRIYAARLSQSLAVLDPNPLAIADEVTANGPSVASDGNGFLVIWSDYQNASSFTSPRVMAQRVSSIGSMLGPTNGVPLTPGSAKNVVWDGIQYDVALSTSFFYYGPLKYPLYTYTLYVTHVAAAGPIESLAPLSVITNTFDPNAALFVTGTGQTNVVYTRLGSEPQYGDVERAFVGVPHALRGRAAR